MMITLDLLFLSLYVCVELSICEVFPQTLSILLMALWDQVVTDLNNNAPTVANFEQAI
jgi:hypothetical protein